MPGNRLLQQQQIFADINRTPKKSQSPCRAIVSCNDVTTKGGNSYVAKVSQSPHWGIASGNSYELRGITSSRNSLNPEFR
jgi:hypothetical protein